MGKSLLVVMLCVGCVNNVSEKARTGLDGTIKGAREVVLEEGVGKQRDIVTYPGGDRIDWKKVVLPEKAKGTLDLKMKYTTPRPHLKVTFDVFDQWHHPVKAAVAGRGRNKSMSIDKAKGTYYVRVYAPRRMDAATYTIEASFDPEPTLAGIEIEKIPSRRSRGSRSRRSRSPIRRGCRRCRTRIPSAWSRMTRPTMRARTSARRARRRTTRGA